MGTVTVRKGTGSDAGDFARLVVALAKYEKLKPPSPAGIRRLVRDVFVARRINLLMARVDGEAIGYALYFYTYSSFLALPTLYLEDLFVLEKHRGGGAGGALFRRCLKEAMDHGCGRMEWAVLTWNRRAIDFYEGLGAKRMSEWYVYRLDRKGIEGAFKMGKRHGHRKL
jgi:GNAT superfamily N-acetyltransferase